MWEKFKSAIYHIFTTDIHADKLFMFILQAGILKSLQIPSRIVLSITNAAYFVAYTSSYLCRIVKYISISTDAIE